MEQDILTPRVTFSLSCLKNYRQVVPENMRLTDLFTSYAGINKLGLGERIPFNSFSSTHIFHILFELKDLLVPLKCLLKVPESSFKSYVFWESPYIQTLFPFLQYISFFMISFSVFNCSRKQNIHSSYM